MDRNTLKTIFSSDKMDWRTPKGLITYLQQAKGPFHLDAAANETNHVCDRWLGPGGMWENGLSDRPWRGRNIWLNPPYGKDVGEWVRRAWVESQMATDHHPKTVTVLIFARTDTQWWHDWAMRASKITFIKGRLTFYREGSKGEAAPAPSALLTFARNLTPYPTIHSLELAPEHRR